MSNNISKFKTKNFLLKCAVLHSSYNLVYYALKFNAAPYQLII